MKIIPQWLLRNVGLRTSREFKQRKRKEFRALKTAARDFHLASAWIPGFDAHIHPLFKLMHEIEDDVSVENWGR